VSPAPKTSGTSITSAPGDAGTSPGPAQEAELPCATTVTEGRPAGCPTPRASSTARRRWCSSSWSSPPPEGDRLDELVARLPIPDDSIEPALSALQLAGLAVRDGDVARASAPALYFEYLWPVGL
jgi:hypothetical protein